MASIKCSILYVHTYERYYVHIIETITLICSNSGSWKASKNIISLDTCHFLLYSVYKC